MKTPIRISVLVFAFAAALTPLLIVFFSAKPAMKEGVGEEASVSMAEDKMAAGNKPVVPIRQAEPSQPEENPSGPRILLPDWYHEGSLVSTNEFTAPEPTHPAGLPMITSKSGLLDYAAGQAKQIRIIAAGITNDFPVNGASKIIGKKKPAIATADGGFRCGNVAGWVGRAGALTRQTWLSLG